MDMSMCEHALNDLYILINIIYCCKSSHWVDKIWFEDKIEERRQNNKGVDDSSLYCVVKNEGVDDDGWEYQYLEKERERERSIMIG